MNEATRLALLEQSMKQNKEDHKDLKSVILRIEDKLDEVIDDKVDKSEFLTWRNWLVLGIIGSTFVAVLGLILDKFLK